MGLFFCELSAPIFCPFFHYDVSVSIYLQKSFIYLDYNPLSLTYSEKVLMKVRIPGYLSRAQMKKSQSYEAQGFESLHLCHNLAENCIPQ